MVLVSFLLRPRGTKWLECWSKWAGFTRIYTSGPTAQAKIYKVVCVLVTVARMYKELLWLPGSTRRATEMALRCPQANIGRGIPPVDPGSFNTSTWVAVVVARVL